MACSADMSAADGAEGLRVGRRHVAPQWRASLRWQDAQYAMTVREGVTGAKGVLRHDGASAVAAAFPLHVSVCLVELQRGKPHALYDLAAGVDLRWQCSHGGSYQIAVTGHSAMLSVRAQVPGCGRVPHRGSEGTPPGCRVGACTRLV